MDTEIEEVKQEIRKVEQQIVYVEGQVTQAATVADVAYWREEKLHLRKKEEQLREEKLRKEEQLREEKLRKEEQLREEKLHLRKKEEQLREEKLRKEEQLREEKLRKEEQLREEKLHLRKKEELLWEKDLLLFKAETSGTPKIDNTLLIRKDIVQQRVRICNVDELPGLLETELEDGLRFPVTLNMWNSLPPNRGKLFKLAGPNEECYKIFRLVDAIVDPPMPSADTEDSFHRFWDTVIEEPLKFFYDGPWLAERNKSGEGSVSGTRPDMVVRFRFGRYALWRGEEKGPSTAGDPKEELISKLHWTYKNLPFLMAYYARGTRVTFCALHVVESKKMCNDLIQFHTSLAEERLKLVLACITLAKLLKTMEEVCEGVNEKSDMPLIQRDSGKVIRPFGRKVEKSYPNEALYRKVKAIYEATSSCPSVEHLLHTRDSERTIVVQRAVVAKPNNKDELTACIRCLCEALQWLHGRGLMHRDVRWENVLRDWKDAGKWVLVDLDEVIERDQCFELHPLDATSHAPEMIVGPHDTMVDIWGIGNLLFTSNVLLDSKLSSLMEKCSHPEPERRPSAAECLMLLDV